MDRKGPCGFESHWCYKNNNFLTHMGQTKFHTNDVIKIVNPDKSPEYEVIKGKLFTIIKNYGRGRYLLESVDTGTTITCNEIHMSIFDRSVGKKFIDQNGIVVDPNLREDYITIFDPDGNELITTHEKIVVDNIRKQIYKNNLVGYYVIDKNGKRHNIENGEPFDVMKVYVNQLAELTKIKFENKK